MQFIDRIKFYFIGIFFGLIIVYFLLFTGKSRDFTKWLPENRILEQLQSRSIVYNKQIECLLNCYRITPTDIQNLLKSGNVDFSRSSPRKNPPEYWIEGNTIIGNQIHILISTLDSNSIITKVENTTLSETCNCK